MVPVRRAVGETDIPVGLAGDRPSSPIPRHRSRPITMSPRVIVTDDNAAAAAASVVTVAASGRISRARHDWPTNGQGGVAWNVIDFFSFYFSRRPLSVALAHTHHTARYLRPPRFAFFRVSFLPIYLSLIIIVILLFLLIYYYYYTFSLSTHTHTHIDNNIIYACPFSRYVRVRLWLLTLHVSLLYRSSASGNVVGRYIHLTLYRTSYNTTFMPAACFCVRGNKRFVYSSGRGRAHACLVSMCRGRVIFVRVHKIHHR